MRHLVTFFCRQCRSAFFFFLDAVATTLKLAAAVVTVFFLVRTAIAAFPHMSVLKKPFEPMIAVVRE